MDFNRLSIKGSLILYKMIDGMIEKKAYMDFQDAGHTGKIHNALSENDKHYGMFIFSFNDYPESKYIAFELILNVKSFYSDVSVGNNLFRVVPGIFTNPDAIARNTFLDNTSLADCGWKPFTYWITRKEEQLDGSFIERQVLHTVEQFVSNVPGRVLDLEFHFNFSGRTLGFLIDPCVVPDGQSFSVEFNHYTEFPSLNRPTLYCLPKKRYFNASDSADGEDYYPRYQYVKLKGLDRVHLQSEFKVLENSKHFGVSKPEVRGIDETVNHSMSIQHVLLSEKGRILEIYGFNGYTERYYYPDSGRLYEHMELIKLNYVTWSGKMVEWPWASMLWYGEIIYFADRDEFGECCRTYFVEHSDDECPICKKPLGKHLKYSFIDITRIPHQFYFCSEDCMHVFNAKPNFYLKALTKSNMEYLLELL